MSVLDPRFGDDRCGHVSQSSACTSTGAADDAVVTPTASAGIGKRLLPT